MCHLATQLHKSSLGRFIGTLKCYMDLTIKLLAYYIPPLLVTVDTPQQ